MKKMRKSVAILAVLSLLATLWAPMAVTAETAPVAKEPRAQSTLYAAGELLEVLPNGEALRYVYDRCIDGIIAGEEIITFSCGAYTITTEEADIIASVVNATIPESYGDNIGHSYGNLYVDSDTVTFSSWFYDWGLNETQKDITRRQVKELTAGLEGKSDYDKSQILYQRLLQRNVYDYGTYHQTAYGPLVEGMSVCAGYARTYQMLLHEVGIPALYVSGVANGGGHAWNIVLLDGQWYYSDSTWDDSDNGSVSYGYFNLTYAAMHQDHTLDSSYEQWAPRSTATANNYFYRNNLVFTCTFSDADIQRLAEIMAHQNPVNIYLMDLEYDPDGNHNHDAVWALFDVLYDVAELLNLSNYSCSIRSGSFPNTPTLSITYNHTHNYHAQVKTPTCVAGGFTVYSCTECAENRIDDRIDPLGHDMVSFPAKTPTCVEMGWDAYEMCARCGYSTQQTLWGDCHYEVVEIVEPDCYNYGYTRYACSGCGNDYYDDYIDPLGHDISDNWWYNEWMHGHACTRCDYVESAQWHDTSDACDTCGYGKEPAIILGDANGDGKLNNRDLGLLQQYLNGWEVTIAVEACDLYADGKVNNRDLGSLQRILNQ